MKRLSLLFTLLVAISVLLAACLSPTGGGPSATPEPALAAPAATEAPAEEPAAEAPATKVALKVTGAVANEQAWTEDEIKAMDTLDVESTNNSGEKSTYTGVLIADLLAAAEPNADANMVVFVGESTAEVDLAELTACADCVLSFRNKGGFSSVLPGFPGKSQVKGVVELQVK